MMQLLLVNRGDSLNTKYNGLFTYFYLAKLIDFLDARYTQGLWGLCQLCQTGLVGLAAWPNLPAWEELQFGFLTADSDSQDTLPCCRAKWEEFCAKTDRHFFYMMLPSLLLSCKTPTDLWMEHQGFILCSSF